MSSASVLKVENLTFSYDKTQELLKDVSFDIGAGSILTVLGQNGAGKTTLLNCILGNINKYGGEIYLNDKNIKQYSNKEIASNVAYVPQLSDISFDYTVEEFVLMGCNPGMGYFSQPNKDCYQTVEDKLLQLGISHLKDRHLQNISGGEKQLVYIARALAQNPKVIVMDEPTSALDYGNSRKILDLLLTLKQSGYAIILTCHNPEYPFILNDKTIAIYKNGGYLFGNTTEILTQETLTKLYGVAIQPLYLDEFNKWICIAK